MQSQMHDPYAGNILIEKLGPIFSLEEAMKCLFYAPDVPSSMDGISAHIRLHHLMAVRDFHLPPPIECQLMQTVDLMVRQTYRYRDPKNAATWATISGQHRRGPVLLPTAFAAAVEGISGVGKTQACRRCLLNLPQTIWHESFPRMEGELLQVVWQSVEVPPSGKSGDLARALMEGWHMSTGRHRFAHWLSKDKIADGMRALDEWRQVSFSHFLGVLHLDEIQNLFKLSSLQQRKNRTKVTEAPELSIVEDQLLRWLLQLTNSGQIALLVSGTPDGIGALTKRLSTLERLNTAGYHAFEPLSIDPDPTFSNFFLDRLGRYQYFQNPLPMDENIKRLIMDLTAGVQRIIIALWVAAHRVALDRGSDALRQSDFKLAAETWLAPLAPAISALRSKDANRISRYDDLVPRDTAFWVKFWQSIRSATDVART